MQQGPPMWRRLLDRPMWYRLLDRPMWRRLLDRPMWRRLLDRPMWYRLLDRPMWYRLLYKGRRTAMTTKLERRWILPAALCLLAASCFLLLQGAKAPDSATVRDRVEILRDRWGVPHIYAKNSD